MSKRILIEFRDGKREIALMDENRLLSFFREGEKAVEAEQIYVGAVDRMVKGMEAAFVKLGKDTVGFLPFSECRGKPRSGDLIPVQVKRPPTGEKAALLTTDLSFAGRYTLLTPFCPRRAVSKRIESEEDQKQLLSMASSLAPKGMGLVMRQESLMAKEADILSEIREHEAAFQTLMEKAKAADAPCLLRGREDALARLLRDEHGSISEIVTNEPDKLPPVSLPVRACENPFALYNVAHRLEKSLQRKIWLDCGGFLVWDRTEAMTVIDVNSGKYTGSKAGTEATFKKLNLEAAREIARLLRLRNTGGIIIIDFVDMQQEESRTEVLEALKDALSDDPVKTVLHGFTSLGLMEMTRKKTEGVSSSLPICPRCHGLGFIEEAL